jgi:glycine hydroxymethyltransferase
VVQRGAIRRAREDHLIDYDRSRKLATEHKPKLIIAGGSAYPRIIDFARFREIADKVGACSWSTWRTSPAWSPGRAPQPLPACPCRHHDHAQDAARPARRHDPDQRRSHRQEDQLGGLPRLQGGPLMHVIAAKAVAFGEALQPDFKAYAARWSPMQGACRR